ncbi:MAG: STAS domain-containing protein [Sedimentisphaerales bacterium]|nr:STAS domain-containing protein [Sedimentisphaerales bacterium]
MSEADKTGVVKNIRNEQNAVVLELRGDIDMSRSSELREQILDVLQQKPAALVINMTDVAFMDSSGLATLVEAMQLSQRHGSSLRLTGLATRVRSVFEISRLDTIFEIYESESEALS